MSTPFGLLTAVAHVFADAIELAEPGEIEAVAQEADPDPEQVALAAV